MSGWIDTVVCSNDVHFACPDQTAGPMKSTFRGVFLTSEDPACTARFYQDIARLELEVVGREGAYQYWKIDRDGVQLAVHDAKAFAEYTFPVCAESNVTHLYFKIHSIAEFLAHLTAHGIEPCCSDDVVVTVQDPDGRKVMFGTA